MRIFLTAQVSVKRARQRLIASISAGASSQAAYSACKATSTATVSDQRRARLRRSAARGIGSPAGLRHGRRHAGPVARHWSLVCRQQAYGAWVLFRSVTLTEPGVANRQPGWPRSSAVDAGCRPRDRCGRRCERDGRGWRRHRSGRRSRHAICRPGSGW